jgi:methylglutaconyl-CoA hydratase
MYQTLEIERAGKVATIWMNRPAVFNAFDEQLIGELTLACQELDADADVRVVILGGRGKHFGRCRPQLDEARRAIHPRAECRGCPQVRRHAARPLRPNKPTIARVQGAALGGGTGLTAACDMAVASDDAAFSTSEVKFGIIPSVISPYVLRAIGPRHALRYPERRADQRPARPGHRPGRRGGAAR